MIAENALSLSAGGAWWLGLRVVHGQVEQLGAAGDAQLVKNTEQVVLDRMRAEIESVSNFAVGHTPGQVLNDLAFALGKQVDPLVIGGLDARRVGKSFERLIQIDAPRPDLSFMDAANALAKAFESLLLGKNTLRASAKALQNILWLGRVQQDDALDLGPERTHLPQHLGAAARLVVQIVTDDHDIDGHASDGRQQLLGIRGLDYDLQTAIIAQSVGEELRMDACAVGNNDTDKVRAQSWSWDGIKVS